MRPGPTVQPSLLPPSSAGLQTHARAHTYARTHTHRAPAACVGFVCLLGPLFCCLGTRVSQMMLWVHPALGSEEQFGARSPQSTLAWRSLMGGPLPGSLVADHLRKQLWTGCLGT